MSTHFLQARGASQLQMPTAAPLKSRLPRPLLPGRVSPVDLVLVPTSPTSFLPLAHSSQRENTAAQPLLLLGPSSGLLLLPAQPLGQLAPFPISTQAPFFSQQQPWAFPPPGPLPTGQVSSATVTGGVAGGQCPIHASSASSNAGLYWPFSPGPCSPAGLPEATLTPPLALLPPWPNVLCSYGWIFPLTSKHQIAQWSELDIRITLFLSSTGISLRMWRNTPPRLVFRGLLTSCGVSEGF